MEIFKFCEIAQMKNLKEKMHWAVFWLIACKAVRLIFMYLFNFFQTFFSSIHFEKLKLYNQTKATPHKDCATDASSNFSSDETKSGVNT